MAATDEMVGIASRIKPDAVSLVPENPNEVTTEGGLNVTGNFDSVKNAIEKLKQAGIFVSIFIDPDTEQIDAAKRAGVRHIVKLSAIGVDDATQPTAIKGHAANEQHIRESGLEFTFLRPNSFMQNIITYFPPRNGAIYLPWGTKFWTPADRLWREIVDAMVDPWTQGASTIIGWVIIAFALYEAWTLNRKMRLEVSGPFFTRQAPPPAAT
jgi:hypothetical protein